MAKSGKCNGKTCYQTQADAEASARYLARIKHWRLNAYQCPRCGMWHLGSDRGIRVARVHRILDELGERDENTNLD